MTKEVNCLNKIFENKIHFYSDHGATINCTSVQVDGNNNPLFESLSKSLVLNVTYPPQPVYGDVDETNPVERTRVEVTEGGNQTVTVVVKANPDPTYFKWTMTYYMDPATNKTKDSVELNEAGNELVIHSLRKKSENLWQCFVEFLQTLTSTA